MRPFQMFLTVESVYQCVLKHHTEIHCEAAGLPTRIMNANEIIVEVRLLKCKFSLMNYVELKCTENAKINKNFKTK